MNKHIIIFSALMLGFTINLFSQTDQAMILGKDVRVRSAEGSESEVLFKVDSYEKLTVLKKGRLEKIGAFNDYWYKVKIRDKEGWVYGAFTSFAEKVTGKFETSTAVLQEGFVGEDGSGYTFKTQGGKILFFHLCLPCDQIRLQDEPAYINQVLPSMTGKTFIITYRTERYWYEPSASWENFNVIHKILTVSNQD